MKERVKKIFWIVVHSICAIVIVQGLLIIAVLHLSTFFLPILLLFDFYFWIGHTLFLRYVLKKKREDYTKNEYAKFKYLVLPSLLMVVLFLLVLFIYYPLEVSQILEQLSTKL